MARPKKVVTVETPLDVIIQTIKAPEAIQPPIVPRPKVKLGTELLRPGASVSDIIKKVNELIDAK